MPTAVKEDYLKALYYLDKTDNKINLTELSKKLEVSKPTANNMIKSLEELGWVIYRKYKPVELTEKGRKEAALIIRKHRLTEMFLFKIMNFGWEEVHEIAEQIEHIQSEKFFVRMDEMLNFPSLDPHGSPIPDAEGNVVEPPYQPLITLKPNQRGKLCALSNSSAQFLRYLNQKQIRIGTQIEVLQIEEYDQSLIISCDAKQPMTVSQKVGEQLLVEVI